MEAKNKYFEQALSDFTFDVSCGVAIRHLVDLEYSVKQIMQNISQPNIFLKLCCRNGDLYERLFCI